MTSSALEFDTVGIILGTERFDACLAFYRDTLGLPVWFEKDQLVCLHYGDGYLMIETGGFAKDAVKSNTQNPTMLRFNVADVYASAELLRDKGVDVDVKEFNWGIVGTFADPDGNKCELKDAGDRFFQRSAGTSQ